LGHINGDDQKRAASPTDAVNFGSNILVVGRPVTGASNPNEVLHQIYNQLCN